MQRAATTAWERAACVRYTWLRGPTRSSCCGAGLPRWPRRRAASRHGAARWRHMHAHRHTQDACTHAPAHATCARMRVHVACCMCVCHQVLPPSVDEFAWCTWDAFYSKVCLLWPCLLWTCLLWPCLLWPCLLWLHLLRDASYSKVRACSVAQYYGRLLLHSSLRACCATHPRYATHPRSPCYTPLPGRARWRAPRAAFAARGRHACAHADSRRRLADCYAA